jgi:hypothetical protein
MDGIIQTYETTNVRVTVERRDEEYDPPMYFVTGYIWDAYEGVFLQNGRDAQISNKFSEDEASMLTYAQQLFKEFG